jgi:predicted trehalose synthase
MADSHFPPEQSDELDRRIERGAAHALEDRTLQGNGGAVKTATEENVNASTDAGIAANTALAEAIIATIRADHHEASKSRTAHEDAIMDGLRRATARLEYRVNVIQVLLYAFYTQSILFIGRQLGHTPDSMVTAYIAGSVILVLATATLQIRDMKTTRTGKRGHDA